MLLHQRRSTTDTGGQINTDSDTKVLVLVLAEARRKPTLQAQLLGLEAASSTAVSVLDVNSVLEEASLLDAKMWESEGGVAAALRGNEKGGGKAHQLPFPFSSATAARDLPSRAAGAGAHVQRCSHLFFTSGTTGEPKPVATLSTGLHAYTAAAADWYSIQLSDRVMIATVPTFDPSVVRLSLPL